MFVLCFHFLSSNTVLIQAFGKTSFLNWNGRQRFSQQQPQPHHSPLDLPTTRWVFEGFGSSSEGTAALGATYVIFLKKKNNLSKSMHVQQMCQSTAGGQIIQAKRGKADPSLALGPIPGEGRCLQPWASFNGQGDKGCSATHRGSLSKTHTQKAHPMSVNLQKNNMHQS